MFYPTGNSTNGRTLVSMNDNMDSILPMQESENPFLDKLGSWLETNEYCVEKRELKYFMENCSACSVEEITEMEGGAPDGGGGAFATLGTTPGMGNVAEPGVDGSPGSGDKFTTLSAGTPAAKKRRGRRKKRIMKKKKVYSAISDFSSFIKAMKAYQ